MRSFIALAVRRRVTVLMVAFAAAAFGIVGYQRLALDLLPDISYPSLTVQTEFPDTAPAEVENLITRPVEETLGVVKGLRTIHSVSRPGVSEVTLEFEWDADMDLLLMDVREKLDRLILPEEATDPIVLRFDPSLDPIMRLALSGPLPLTELRQVADRRIKQEFETIRGIAAARVKGGLEEEIQIDIQQDRLAALGIPLERVRAVIGGSNVNLPGGSLQDEESQYLIRTVNEYDSIEEISDLIIQEEEGATVRLRDVADVRRGAKERVEITRVGGAEAVEIDLYKEGDANTVTAAQAARDRMREVMEDLPEGCKITVLFDQSRFIRQAIDEVRSSALIGGLLAILVLFAFLRDIRSTLIIATAIPLSLIVTFMAMYRMNISLNVMSLGGLALGIGMLVDNAIVVLEAVFRKRAEGASLTAAAIAGTSEVAGAVIASTLTTVAVFLPLIFVEGIAGQLFGDMAITVTLSLMTSLVVSLTIAPMLSAIGRDRPLPPGSRLLSDEVRRSAGSEAMTLGAFSRHYDRLLRGALDRRWLTIATSLALFAGSMALLPLLHTELIPDIREGEFFFELQMPEGTPLAVTDQVTQRLEKMVAEEPGVGSYHSTVGSRMIQGGIAANSKAPHFAQIDLVVADRADEHEEERLTARLRERFAGIPDLTAKLGKPSYFSTKTPIEVLIFSENLELLREASQELHRTVEQIPGVVDVRSSFEEGTPEIQIVFDRNRLASLGLDLRTVSESLRDRLQGAVATRYKESDRQIDVRVRNREIDRADLADVQNLVVEGPNGEAIRLLTIADVRIDRGPAEIHRVHQQRAAVVSGNLQGRSLGAAVADIEHALAQSPLPPGVSVELGGQIEEMRVSFASLRLMLLLAIFLVYLVMAATFESLLHPFLIMFTIPLGLIGVVLGLLLMGTEVSVIVLLGVILLAGIVVDNAIVLIDKVNQLRSLGWGKREAIIEASHVRLRPILMTTLTTILGLLPMAFSIGQGAELRAPLAITVLFGLSLCTLLTLLVIPVLYMMVPSRVPVVAVEHAATGAGETPVRAHTPPTPEGALG